MHQDNEKNNNLEEKSVDNHPELIQGYKVPIGQRKGGHPRKTGRANKARVTELLTHLDATGQLYNEQDTDGNQTNKPELPETEPKADSRRKKSRRRSRR